jgi:hypothetical protein
MIHLRSVCDGGSAGWPEMIHLGSICDGGGAGWLEMIHLGSICDGGLFRQDCRDRFSIPSRDADADRSPCGSILHSISRCRRGSIPLRIDSPFHLEMPERIDQQGNQRG